MLQRATLGAYPSDAYFDPHRPSWLPYWIDTLSESAMKYGFYPGVAPLKTPDSAIYQPPPEPLPPGPPDNLTTPPASREEAETAVDTALRRSWERTIASLKQFYDDEWERIEAAKPKPGLGMGWLWVAAAAGLGLMIVLKR